MSESQGGRASAGLTTVTVWGRVGSDPAVKFTPGGVCVVTFSLAVNERVKDDAGQWSNGGTTWWRVTVWRSVAEKFTEARVNKGDSVCVSGRMKLAEYVTRDGEKRQALELTADEVGVSVATLGRDAGSGKPPAARAGERPRVVNEPPSYEDPWAHDEPAF